MRFLIASRLRSLSPDLRAMLMAALGTNETQKAKGDASTKGQLLCSLLSTG